MAPTATQTTTYTSLQAGSTLVERDPTSGNVTLTLSDSNIGLTIPAADFDAIVENWASLKSQQPKQPSR